MDEPYLGVVRVGQTEVKEHGVWVCGGGGCRHFEVDS